MGFEPIQMLEGFEHALPAQAVESPEQHHIKLALSCIDKELSELCAIGTAAAFMINIFGHDLPILSTGELP